MLALALLVGCSSGTPAPEAPTAATVPANPPRPATCTPPPTPDPVTAEGWLGITAASPDDVGLVLDDGRGLVVSHGADRQMPLASSVKIVHAAAYGRAVAEGRARPDEPIRLGDWERWYFPTDGGAHPRALQRLGIPSAGGVTTDPNRTVPLEVLVGAMIRESDNAATDYLRDRLGDEALTRTAADGGWRDLDLPSELGAALALVRPEEAPPLTAPRRERGPAEVALARRYANDPAFAVDSIQRLAALAQDQEAFILENERWAAATATGSAAQLAAMWRSVISGSFGPGADVARAQLEYTGPRANGDVRAFKGGSFLGVGTLGLSARRPDGTLAIGVLLGRGFAPTTPADAVGDAQAELVVGALGDPADLSRVLCVA